MVDFDRPFGVAASRDRFSSREVGLTHPDNGTYIRLCDNGNIEMMVSANFGIVLDNASRSVNIYADSLIVHTKETDGFRWNRLSFNSRATKYTEPPFIETLITDFSSIFDGVEQLVGKGKTVT